MLIKPQYYEALYATTAAGYCSINGRSHGQLKYYIRFDHHYGTVTVSTDVATWGTIPRLPAAIFSAHFGATVHSL